MISQFTSVGKNGTYDQLLAIVLQFQTNLNQINENKIKDIPQEIMRVILNSSNTQSQLNLSLTCKRFYGLLDENHWKKKATPFWYRIKGVDKISFSLDTIQKIAGIQGEKFCKTSIESNRDRIFLSNQLRIRFK